MPDLQEIPLFPLNTVLFPGQALSLHIFEDRYKLMINRCLEEGHPVGIVLIRDGEEVGEPAVPHQVGTLATIMETERHENGEIDIIAVGQERFVIHEILQDRPYIIGQVESFPAVGADTPRAAALAFVAKELLPRYIDALTEATGTFVQVVNVPDGPAAVAFLIALALQINPNERQTLLAMAEVEEMLARENTLLRREITILEYMATTQMNDDMLLKTQFGYISMN